MTTLLSPALRMPHMASVAAPAPHAPGAWAEPCAPAMPVHAGRKLEMGGIISPASEGRRGGTDGSDRDGGMARFGAGSTGSGQDLAQLAGGGPLRE
jgi:hypothetical protein